LIITEVFNSKFQSHNVLACFRCPLGILLAVTKREFAAPAIVGQNNQHAALFNKANIRRLI